MASPTAKPKVKNSLKRLESQLIKLTNPQCNLCPLSGETDRVCIPVNPARKPRQDRLIVIAEAPGSNEEQTGSLLSGRAGQFLWEELDKLGFAREDFFITNAVKCRPEDNDTPTDREIRECGYYLKQEMALIKAKYGLALGNSGLKATLGRKGITKFNATTFEAYETTFVGAFHPAAVLRNPSYLAAFQAALLVFKRLVYNEEGIPITRTIAVNDKDTLRQLIADLETAKRGAIDTETWSEHELGGLYPWDPSARLSGLNISVMPGKAYVVPLWTTGSRWKDPQKVLDVLKPHLEAVKYWYMHNGKFDEQWLERFGIHLRQHFDTMGAIYAIDENNRKDLGFASQVYLGAPEYKDLLNKKHTNLTPLDDLVEYGGQDADYTLRLGRKLTTALKKEPASKRLFTKLLMPAVNVLTDVETVGLPVHRGKFEKRWAVTEQRIGEYHEQILDYVPDKLLPFNPRSPQQLGRLLYKRLEFPIIEETPTGAPSTAEGVLIRLRDLDEGGVINAILDYRQWNGYGSRYFANWDKYMDAAGRLHPTFKPFHTVTGRLSAANPNVQQIPRDTFIRGIIGGRRGWRVVEVDYSQVELRIVAHISQDRSMLHAFLADRDIHTETAMAITGKPEMEIASEERKMAKAVNFGFVYGMGAAKFRSYAKEKFEVEVSEAQAQNFRRDYFRNFNRLQAWHDRQRRAAHRRGWVISPIGRKRHLHDIRSDNKKVQAEAERQAINSPVQSMASDMMLMSMILLHEQLDPRVARIISTVHDSILFEIREEAVDDVLPGIIQTMENLPLEEVFGCVLTVPIKADAKVGKFWAEGADLLVS
jgi:uracil-DNA glycosylase family 4